jgi:hypothetical protein
MRTFNERIQPKASQGWSVYGMFTPEGWNNRLFPGTMTGFYFEAFIPSIRTMKIGGVAGKGIVISWGERGKYQIYFEGSEEGRNYKSVYSKPGRFELGFYGEIEAVRTIRCSEPTLNGNTRQLKLLAGLHVIDLQGTMVKARTEDFAELDLKELVLTGTELVGDIADFSNQSGLEVLNLAGVTGLQGYMNVIVHMPSLRVLNLKGCGLSYYPDVIPFSWVEPVIDVSDNGLSAAEVDQLLQDLANSYVTNGTLDIAGNNAAHTEASNEALIVLQTLGWNLMYNGEAPVPSPLAMTSFRLLAADNPVLGADVEAVVLGRYIKIQLPNNTPVTALMPTIAVTAGASVDPESLEAIDFTASLT